MAIELYTDVILTVDLPEEDLKAGDIGTVVERHVAPGVEDGYSVEFFDMTGHTIGVVAIAAKLLRAPTESDRPTVRPIGARS